MPILHSVKQLFSNFLLVWKLIVYYLVCAAVLAGLWFAAIYPVVNPLLEKILATGIWEDLKKVAVDYVFMSANLADSITVFQQASEQVSRLSLELAGSFTVAYVLLAVWYLVARFLFLLKDVPVAQLVSERMTSRQKGFFTGLFIRNMGKSSIYALTVMMFCLPADVLLTALSVLVGRLFVGWLGLFGIFFAVAVIMILFSAKNAFFALCLPEVAESGQAFRGVLRGVGKSTKRFVRIYLYMLPFMLLELFVVTAFTFFTFGAALFLMIPVVMILFIIFREVLAFSEQKRSYYVDSQTIVKGRLDNDLPDFEEKKQNSDQL